MCGVGTTLICGLPTLSLADASVILVAMYGVWATAWVIRIAMIRAAG